MNKLSGSIVAATLLLLATGAQAGTQLRGPGLVLQGPGLVLQGPPLVIQGPSLTGFGFYAPAGAPHRIGASAVNQSRPAGFTYPQTLMEACAAPMPRGEWPLSGLDGRAIRVSLPH